MAKPKYAIKKDQNHNPIVEHLEAHGVEVVDCSKAGTLTDLLTLYPKNATRGRAGWLEIKVDGRGTYTAEQLKFIADTSWPVAIVKTKEAALEFATKGEGYLTDDQKNRIAVFLLKNPGVKKWNSEQVERILES